MNHTCHWKGCKKEVPPKMWGCKYHWFKLPKWIRSRIWATYKPGQEITKTPSKAYVKAAMIAQKFIDLSEKYGEEIADSELKKFLQKKQAI